MNDIPVRHIEANNNDPNFVGSITVRTIEELTQSSDLIHDFHRHDFFLILFVYQGEGFHEIDFVNYEIKNYSIFFIKPGQVHKLFLKKESIGFILQFDKEFSSSTNSFSQSLLKKINHLNICQLTPSSLDKIHYSLNYIYDEYKKQQPDYIELIKANLNIFFIELIRQRNSLNKESQGTHLYKQQKLERFLDLIEENILKYKQVSKYAEMLNLTVYQLNAITKGLLNKNASDLINEYIILESKRNLLATSNLVSQIAYNLGFEDTSYFIRFFKKHTGHTPEIFRQQKNSNV